MELLPDELKSRLPPLLTQEAEEEPMVYARYFLPRTRWSWYVTEGEPGEDDFLFSGFVTGIADEYRQFRLSELRTLTNAAGEGVMLDDAFTVGRLTHVVPAPDL